MASEEVGLRITATDDASRVLDDVAEALDELDDGADVEVDADTRDAQRAIERFGDELDDLSGDAREVRIEFKRQQLERDIKSILRDLDRLDDPVEIDARSQDLEQAIDDLGELKRLAGERYDIDLDVDPKRTARAAVDDVEALRGKGEGLQSAIPAIRGFGDELGGTAASAGIASQAVADLGDFALIAGERFAGEGSRIAGVATRLGTVLGAAGLAGAIAGIGVQIGQLVGPAFLSWVRGTDDVIEANDEVAESFRGIGEAVEQQRYAEAIRSVVDANDELIDTGRGLGQSTEQMVRYLLRLDDALDPGEVDTTSAAWRQFAVDIGAARDVILRDQADYINLSNIIGGLATELAAAGTEGATTAEKVAALQALADDLAGTAPATGSALARMGDDAAGAGDDVADLGDEVSETQRRIDTLRGKLDLRREFRDLRSAGEEALGAVLDYLADGETSADEATAAMERYKLGILDALENLDGVPPQKVTEILALADAGSVAEVDRQLRILTLPRSIQITTNFRNAQGADRDVGLLDRTQQTALAPSSTNVTLNLPASDGRSISREVSRWARVNG